MTEELAADVVNDYLVNSFSSVSDIEARYRLHLLPAFGNRKASQITTDQIKAYIVKRMAEAAKSASINRELEAMRHAFRLAKESTPPKVHTIPHFPMLKEDNVRRILRTRSPGGYLPLLACASCTGCPLWLHHRLETRRSGDAYTRPCGFRRW